MAETVKLIGAEIALSTANTVGGAVVVRCYNNTAAAVFVTRFNPLASPEITMGSCTLGAGAVEYFIKLPTDTLTSNIAIKAASVAFS